MLINTILRSNKRLSLSCVLLASWLLLAGCNNVTEYSIESPNNEITVTFSLTKDGKPQYAIQSNGMWVIKTSTMGLTTEYENYFDSLTLDDVSEVSKINDHYTMFQGKRKDNTYTASEQTFHLTNTQNLSLDIIFRVSDDGVAFRYFLPSSSGKPVKVLEEKTTYNFPDSSKMWVQPMAEAKTGWKRTNPSYEEGYFEGIAVGKRSPTGAGWVYPALFKSNDQWILISETAIGSDDCGTRLYTVPNTTSMRVGYPQPQEIFPRDELVPNTKGDWYSPWRIITMGSLASIVESTLGTDLAEPAIELGNDAFIKPGYASWSWAVLKDDATIYPVQKQFFDYAAEMHWQYCLIDADWDRKIGYDTITDLTKYAAGRGVGLLLWYNSSGSWNDTEYSPKGKLLTHEDREKEFSRLQQIGIKGVKIDFFGGDGQSMMAYYHDILQDAADHNLLVNFHGATLPRGWQRTYPNLMTMEAIKGFEFITFTQEWANNEARHCATIPFTRNVFDPMDFTPMCFSKIPNIERKTTDGFELALPTLFLSGIQHLAETPEGMKDMPDFVQQYLMTLPTHWDDSKFVRGYPGRDVAIARKAGERWYVSGINGENKSKTLTLDLSFIDGAKYGQLITDKEGTDQLESRKIQLSAQGSIEISVQPQGGFVLKL